MSVTAIFRKKTLTKKNLLNFFPSSLVLAAFRMLFILKLNRFSSNNEYLGSNQHQPFFTYELSSQYFLLLLPIELLMPVDRRTAR